MALTILEAANSSSGGFPAFMGGLLGQTQPITVQEVANALLVRGYNAQSSVSISPSISPTVSRPTITRAQAIDAALDYSLRLYGYAKRCILVGGCRLSRQRFDEIVYRSRSLAESYLRAGSIPAALGTLGQQTIAVNPPSLPGWQIEPVAPPPGEQPGMGTWDWVSIISNAVVGAANTLEAYANARAQRERAGQTATLTAAQVKQIVDQAVMQNPTLNRSTLTAAAAGAGGQIQPGGTPAWLLPVVVGGVVVAIISLSTGRRR